MNITAEQRIAASVAVMMSFVCVRYCYLISTGEIAPILATWVIFFVSSGLGLWTYLQANDEEHPRDPITNIANTADVGFIVIILGCMLVLGKEVRFGLTRFEWTCLGIAGIIVILYLWLGNAKVANIAINVLLVIGYVPTVVHLWSAQENSESFVVWGIMLVAQVTALYAPIKKRDFLAGLYAMRAVVSVLIVLALMARIELR